MSSVAETLTAVRPSAPAAAGAAYLLPVAGAAARLARGWLWLGLLALIGSGVFSVLLVASRTPGVQELLPVADFFHVALVVHVDLSVLVWFISLAGLLWSLASTERAWFLGWAALAAAAAGTALMAAAPFAGAGAPIMANYIPVLSGGTFMAGLLLFGLGFAMLVARSLVALPPVAPRDGAAALRLGLGISVIPAAVALVAFLWSYLTTPGELSGKAYYEILFWGGGHALQFTWTLFMLIAWLWLASACGVSVPMSPRIAVASFLLGAVCVLIVPVAYLLWPAHAVEHRNLLTFAMGLGGGLPILPVALAAVMAVRPTTPIPVETRPLRAALYASITLFTVGGVIGFTIAGANVKIPAHYHGCIVGVTLALMGLVYHLLPQLGYAHPPRRLATFSSYCYGVGQLMHVTGLVWSGGYGVQRKVAGAEQVLHSTQEVVAMGIMGLGGLIAILGGLLFVVAVILAIRHGRATTR
jgi:hypothetical protein